MDAPIEPTLQSVDTEVPAIQGKKYWPRAVAYTIDWACMYGLSHLAGLSAGNILGLLLNLFVLSIGRNYYIAETESSTMNNIMIGILQTIFYFWIFEWLYGRTFGKIILGIRVISSTGEIPSLKQAFTRSIYRLVDGLFFGIVAAIYMKPPGYQRIGDQRASTYVVSAGDDSIWYQSIGDLRASTKVVTSDNGAIKKFPPWWKFWLSLFIYFSFDVIIYFIWLLFYLRID